MSESVPDGWVLTKLKHVLSTPSKKKVDNPQNIELLTVKLHGKGIVKSGKYPKPTTKGRPYYRRFEGELLIGRQNLHNGGLGLVSKSQAGLIASNAISSFLSKDNADMRYLHQALSSDWFQNYVDTLSSGTGQKETSETQILEILIPLPPLSEQKKIASILTAVDEVIEKIRKQIDKLEDLKNATMNELLTKGIGHTEFKDSELGRIPKSWGTVGISDVCREIFLGLTSKVDYVDSGGVYLVRATDISRGVLDFSKTKQISREQHQKLTKFRRAKKGDVLVSKSGSLGVCALVDTDTEFSIYESIIVMQSNEKILLSNFLLWFFRSPLTQHQLLGDSVGSTVGHLNLGDFRQLRMTLPSLNEQAEIANKIAEIDAYLNLKKRKLAKTQSLKKSLMQDLLTGKVRVQVN